MTQHSPELLQRAARIRLACFDVDGTLTDGGLVYGPAGESKVFNVMDGFGIRLLEENGIRVAFITARKGEIVAARARDLRIEHVHVATGDKAASLRAIAASLGLEPDAASHMGDDLNDLPAMAIAGLAVAPANAHPWVAERVHWQTRARGGDGAARELCDLILEAHGLRPAILAAHGAG
jgi:3-deoxy-D-manno-octulosonate 8-phosphate phosphatase (KDO 8-P phosphatase)